MNKYRLPLRYRSPNAIRTTLLIIATLLACYGLWWSCTTARQGYQLYVHANERVMLAEMRADNAMADVKLAMEMLAGERPVGTEDGLETARVRWRSVELVRGLQ